MIILLLVAPLPAAHAIDVQSVCPDDKSLSGFSAASAANSPGTPGGKGEAGISTEQYTPLLTPPTSKKLIVIGFMGGHIRADNLTHKEAQLARDLQARYPASLRTGVFANRDGQEALEATLKFLDEDRSGCLSAKEKDAARIVIYGHSWGASEAITLARRLNAIRVPVLLTVQVDSVQKPSENDRQIPPNVREAVNFYQSEGMLHGRRAIEAADPSRTAILGNYASSYRRHSISCSGYPWYAKAFMRPHIEIENDPSIWNRIEKLIAAKAGTVDSGLGIVPGAGANR